MLKTRQERDIFEIRLDEAGQQLEPEKLAELVESIRENGLLIPIALNADNELVAGYHRLMAFKQLYKSDGEAYRHIPVRVLNAEDNQQLQQLSTTEKLFHPELSILEKAAYFKSYFDDLKYGQAGYKTTTIFKTLDISRRTFFNLRAIAERLGAPVRQRILNSPLRTLAHSTPQLLALCKYDEKTQLEILELMQTENCGTIFEAIKLHQHYAETGAERTQKARKFLKSPTLKLEKELRQDLRQLAQQTGLGQNELFNEIFEAGLELIRQKYS